MRRLILVVAACAGLTACAAPEEIAARDAAQDDKDCLAKGNQVGTPGYVDCRAALEERRAERQQQDRTLKLHPIPGMPGVLEPGGA